MTVLISHALSAVPMRHPARCGRTPFALGPDCGDDVVMPFLRRQALDRRTFLRGGAACLALPWLDAMAPAMSAPPKAKPRAVFVYAPNGMNMEQWRPKGNGHRAKFGAPVDGLFIEVGQSMAINDVTLLSLRECGPWLALGDRRGPGEAPISVKRCFACFNSFYEFGYWAGSFDAVVVPR